MVVALGHCVTQLREVGSPNLPMEQLLEQARVLLSPKVMVGEVGQLRAVTQVKPKF